MAVIPADAGDALKGLISAILERTVESVQIRAGSKAQGFDLNRFHMPVTSFSLVNTFFRVLKIFCAAAVIFSALILAGCGGGGVDNKQSGANADGGKQNENGGTFTDSRDNQKYRSVKIGGKTWMAQNLNFTISDSWCYDNEDSNCVKYGRLYTWDAAMTACPEGWRLPTDEVWSDLIRAAGGSIKGGMELKSKTGWNNNGNGTDDHGFSALPCGSRSSGGSFNNIGLNGDWWSAAEGVSVSAYDFNMRSGHGRVDEYVFYKSLGFSVRCVKD